MKCKQIKSIDQQQCAKDAAFRYTWPGEDESYICLDHIHHLRRTAEAIGLQLQLIAIINPIRRSVLQDWVMDLPLREQGTLLTGVRGCDLTPKFPLDSTERELVGWLRWTFLVPFDEREVDAEPGCFFISKVPALNNWRASALGHYPWHWLSHLMHCYEVVGYRHPDQFVRATARAVYVKLAHSFHLNPETFEQFETRLSEDRIAKGEVVS